MGRPKIRCGDCSWFQDDACEWDARYAGDVPMVYIDSSLDDVTANTNAKGCKCYSGPTKPKVSKRKSSYPDPEELAEKAKLAEPTRADIVPYMDSVRVMRSKGYSWREIADWMTEKGVKANHSRLYRAARARGIK